MRGGAGSLRVAGRSESLTQTPSFRRNSTGDEASVTGALAALGSALRQSNAEKQILKQLQRQQTEKGLRPSKRAPMLPAGGSFRSRAWRVTSEPESSRVASAFSFLVLAAICISICAFCLESLPQFRSDPDRGVEDHKTFKAIEYACIAIFTVEYLVRLATCSVSAEYGVDANDFDTSGGAGRPRGFLRASYAFVMSPMNLVDLVAILPFYLELAFAGGGGAAFSVLRVLRLARVFRVLKLGKFCSSLATLVRVMINSASALYLLLFFMGLGCVLFGAAMFFAEGGTWDPNLKAYVRPTLLGDGVEETPFTSIPACFWWVMVTATTVGYGDMSPTTAWGQIVGCMTFYFGIMVLALPITIIGANYAEEYAREIDDEIDALSADVASVDADGGSSSISSSSSSIGGAAKGGAASHGFLAGTDMAKELPTEVAQALAMAHKRMAANMESTLADSRRSLMRMMDGELKQLATVLVQQQERGKHRIERISEEQQRSHGGGSASLQQQAVGGHIARSSATATGVV